METAALIMTKVTVPFTITLLVLGLIIAIWLGYIACLTIKENRACQGSHIEDQVCKISPKYAELQGVINEYSVQKGRIGLQVTVIFPDDLTWTGTAGYADIVEQCPMVPRHHLYIGSMTKLFTAALTMEQVEKGLLRLDDPISMWIHLVKARDITIRNLLNHTSGLPDYAHDPWFQIRWFGLPGKIWKPDELISVIGTKSSRFDPGSRYEYSNSNYLLLGVILEKVTGKPYPLILDEAIREKPGLTDTYFLNYPDDLAIANGYDEALLKLGRRNLTGFRQSLESGAYAAGGILSTSEDVAHFLHALLNGFVISDASLTEMQTFMDAQDEDIPEQTGYGLGLRYLFIGGEDWIGHTGSIPGFSGIAMYNKQKGYTVVILSNLSMIEQTKLLVKVQQVIIQE